VIVAVCSVEKHLDLFTLVNISLNIIYKILI